MDITELENMEKAILALCDRVIKFAEDKKLTNTQVFIDFLDKLNDISVKY